MGRIYDWYKAQGQLPGTPEEDEGVRSVQRIYHYYKSHGYATVVMGASFRNVDQIKALAGCDRLTISPNLLDELQQEQITLPRQLSADRVTREPKVTLDESGFRWLHNEDAMATEKLAEGIRKFAADQDKLEQLLRQW